MSIFDGLLNQVKNAVMDHTSDDRQSNVDRDSLLSKITDLFGQHSDNHERNVRPASEDPYGDPAAQNQSYQNQSGNIRPAREDRYGDPADSGRGNSRRNVRPASEDPYGDPADQ